MIGIITAILLATVGIGGYFLFDSKRTADAPTETKEPEEIYAWLKEIDMID